MKNYMYDLLNKIDEDKGKIINHLINTEVLTKNFIIKKGIETKDANILYNIALYINGLTMQDIDKITEYIIKIGDFDVLYGFAGNIPNAPLDKIVGKIIEMEESKYIFRLAICIKDKTEYIQRLTNTIINLKEPEYIYLYTKDLFSYLETNDVDRLEDAIIKTKDLFYIYEFVENIKRLSIQKLVLAIIKSGDETFIEQIKELENVPEDIDLMIERVELEKKPEHVQLAMLYKLINSEEIASIEYNRDIYRNLFVDNDVEQIEIEEEINQKKKVLTKEPGQGMYKTAISRNRERIDNE